MAVSIAAFQIGTALEKSQKINVDIGKAKTLEREDLTKELRKVEKDLNEKIEEYKDFVDNYLRELYQEKEKGTGEQQTPTPEEVTAPIQALEDVMVSINGEQVNALALARKLTQENEILSDFLDKCK